MKGFNEISEMILKYVPSGTVINEIQKEEPQKTNLTSSMEGKKKALLHLKELLDAGILTTEEFEPEKGKILKG